MAALLEGYSSICTISFLDLYDKVRRNFLEAKEVSEEDKALLVKGLIEIAWQEGAKIRGRLQRLHDVSFLRGCDWRKANSPKRN